MSRFHHLLAVLPLLSVLTMAPAELKSQANYRSLASVEEVKQSAYPKYEARAEKIDRSQIQIPSDLDLSAFSKKGDEFREKLLKERKNYKVDETNKEAVDIQKKVLEELVAGLVELEENVKILKEKKAWDEIGEEIAQKTMAELKTTLESLLQDEIENELIVLKDKSKTQASSSVCDLEEKNKILTKQVEDLLAEQKRILESMTGMSTMMVEMNQRLQQSQQPYSIPSWLMAGSLVNPQFQYPYMATPTIIMINGAQAPQAEMNFIGGSNPQIGQQNFDQNIQSGQYQLGPQLYPTQNNYFSPSPFSSPVMNDPNAFNFGQVGMGQFILPTV
jgi:flagellar motor protein MotB